jgi:hypothetical protein
MDAATNPIMDRTQKMLAAILAVGATSEENTHGRAGNQALVRPRS